MRKVFAEASGVIHHIAEQAIFNQLRHDDLMPVEIRNFLHGETEDKKHIILRDSGWEPVE
jgi:hypothetical protein